MSNDIVTTEKNSGFMQVGTLLDAIKCSELIAKSNFCPQGMSGKPGDVLVALQMGQELGLKPMQALQNIAVINGRPSIWGDAMLAVCRQAPDFEYVQERFDETSMTATCVVKRKNEPEVMQAFSQKDAERAGLWSKVGPWKSYPKRMLQMRARGFALRDAFPDTLRGIIIKEEAEDTPNKRVDYSKSKDFTVDAEAVEPTTITEEQLSELQAALFESDTDPAVVCSAFRVTGLNVMNVEQWQRAINRCNEKIAQAKLTEVVKAVESE